MRSSGGSGVGSVGGQVLSLTAQGKRVLIGAVRAWISSLPGRWTICLCLVWVCDVHVDVCEKKGPQETDKEKGQWKRDVEKFIYMCLCICVHASWVIKTSQKKPKVPIIHTQADKRQAGRDKERMNVRQDQADGRVVRWKRERIYLERQTGGGWARRKTRQSVSTHSWAGRSVLCLQWDIHTVIIYLERGDV